MGRLGLLAVIGLSLFLAAAAGPSSAGDDDALPDDLRWVDPKADSVAALNRTPEECVSIPPDPAQRRLFELGRVAFRSPVLLGGVAARVGLSCDSCHVNGHDNPVFFFAGVSGSPGTADVTGSVFSRAREDDIENPVPIPSLRDAARSPPFGSVLPSEELRAFLVTVVVEEFQGAPPSAAVLDGLTVYLHALRSSACAGAAGMLRPVSLELEGEDLRRSLAVARAALESGDLALAEFSLLSLRARLGRLYQRFPATGPPHALARDRIVALSRSLDFGSGGRAAMSEAVAREGLVESERRLDAILVGLEELESESLYDDAVLRRAIDRARPPD